MNQPPASVLSPLTQNPEAISRRAFEIWQREGCPDGCDLRHWLQAEKELEAANGSGNGSGASQTGQSASTSSTRSAPSSATPVEGTRAAAAAGRPSKSSKRRGGGATM